MIFFGGPHPQKGTNHHLPFDLVCGWKPLKDHAFLWWPKMILSNYMEPYITSFKWMEIVKQPFPK